MKLQEQASPEEKTVWKEMGASKYGGLWRSPEGKPVLPLGAKEGLMEEAHGLRHVGAAHVFHVDERHGEGVCERLLCV